MNLVLASSMVARPPAAPVALPVLPPPVAIDEVRRADDRFRCGPYSCVLSARSCVERQRRAGARLAALGRGTGASSELHAIRQMGGSYRACVDCADGRRVEAALSLS